MNRSPLWRYTTGILNVHAEDALVEERERWNADDRRRLLGENFLSFWERATA